MTIGIYKITCKETGQCYIGQSKRIEIRSEEWRRNHSEAMKAMFAKRHQEEQS